MQINDCQDIMTYGSNGAVPDCRELVLAGTPCPCGYQTLTTRTNYDTSQAQQVILKEHQKHSLALQMTTQS